MNETRKRFGRRLLASSKSNPWVTREIVQLERKIKRKRRKRKENEEEFLELSYLLKQKPSSAKGRYFPETLPNFMRNSPDKFWRHLKPRKERLEYIIENNEIASDPKDIADRFNIFFRGVFVNAEGAIEDFNFSATGSTMGDIIITEEGVFSLLLNLDVKKSTGPDKIPNEFLKRYAEWVSKFLTIIFQTSLKQHHVPPDWRSARVIPILKKRK